MLLTIENILEMKNHENNLGVNSYEWFFMNLENNWISKTNGTKRNKAIIEGYDYEAIHYIIVQLHYVSNEAALDLMKELGMVESNISKEYYEQIVEYQ